MRLISWNIQGRVSRLDGQLAALAERRPDLVALQEVRVSTMAPLIAGLNAIGLPYTAESVSLALDQERRFGLLIASRWPLQPLPLLDVPRQERVLPVLIDSPWGALELYNAHVPQGAGNGWVKVETFEGIYDRLAHLAPHHRILCGDFNSPQQEHSDGYLVTWGQDVLPNGNAAIWKTLRDKTERVDTGHRWDRAERLVLTGLAAYDLTDIFRSLNGYDVQAFSWYWSGRGKKVGRRFDHILASRALNAQTCAYLDWWERDLSDHAPIEAVFAPSVR